MKKIFFIIYLILISFSKQDEEEVSNLVSLNRDYKDFSPIIINIPYSFQMDLNGIENDEEAVIQKK